MTNAAEALKTLMETIEPEKDYDKNKNIDAPDNENSTIDINLDDVPDSSEEGGLYDEQAIDLELN